MKKANFKFVEHILKEYPNSKKYIKEMENEIMNPVSYDVDENVGGGRSNKKDDHVEQMAITIADNQRINAIKRNHEVIKNIYDRSDLETQMIIYGLYFNGQLTLQGVANQTHLSTRQCSRKRTDFFNKVADQLGLY